MTDTAFIESLRTNRELLRLLLRRAVDLRARIQHVMDTNSFVADDLRMEEYNDIAGTLNAIFPGHPEAGSWVQMPDANIQWRGAGRGQPW